MTTNTIATARPTKVRRANASPSAIKPSPSPSTTSKSDTVIKLLLRAKGATAMELIAATDWQPHSVRAFLSGLRKKGRVIVREPRKNDEAAYRIVIGDTAVTQHAAEPDVVTEPQTAGDRASAIGPAA